MGEISLLFFTFLWKNWREIRFRWFPLMFLYVGSMSILIVYLFSTNELLVSPQIIPDKRNSHDLLMEFPINDEDRIFYSPNSQQINTLMEKVRQRLQYPHKAFQAFINSFKMLEAMEHSCTGNCYLVNFENYPLEVGGILQYSISSTIMRISPKIRYMNDDKVAGIKDDDDYLRSGFATLQHTIDKSYINLHDKLDYDFEISPMPIIAQKTFDSQRLIWFGSLYLILFNVLLLNTLLVPLVEEKQNGIKEFLAIATPWHSLNGISFFLIRLLLYMIFTAMMLLAGWYYQVLGTVVSIRYIILLFILFIFSSMSYTYLISVLFHSVFHGYVGGSLLLIMPYILYFSKGIISTIANLFSMKAFMEGVKCFQIFTNKYRKVNSEDLNINITDSSFTISAVYIILLIQCLLYAVVYHYLSYIFPGPGTQKKTYLPTWMTFWKKTTTLNEYTTNKVCTDAIIIQDLKKSFKKPKRLISDGINFVIKNKSITVLLGHNGVGKTTILNMIIGCETADSGKITVCGENNAISYRHLIGFCPQNSIFMPYMTCAQHLQFFAKVRGMSKIEASNVTEELLAKLNLQQKENEYGCSLSGGMKRRLSLGIAIVGNTKVVVLDEPSSGLDIKSRRELWDILLLLRKKKSILITTHHMEEAEVLGDTICILANGRVHCSGSPLELKRKIGRGYVLKLLLNCNCKSEREILEIVRGYIPSAEILSMVFPVIHISLPYEGKGTYKDLLLKLEKKQIDMDIRAISISDSSLEDIFLNCLSEKDVVDSAESNLNLRVPYQSLEPKIRWNHQLMAIVYKKYLFFKNEWINSIKIVLLPLLSLVFAMLLMRSVPMVENEDKLKINLQIMSKGVIFVNGPDSKVLQILERELRKHERITVERLNYSMGANITDVLINLQHQNFAFALEHYIGVIDILSEDAQNIKFDIYFSNNIYHSSVILISLIDNAVLQLKLNNSSGIETTYSPLRRFLTDVSPTRLEYFAVIMPIGAFFSMFPYLKLPYQENYTGFKQLQAIPRTIFWVSTYLVDAISQLLVCILLFILIQGSIYNFSEQVVIVSSILFYGLSYLPILYIFANTFRSISTISTYLLFMLIISATVPLLTSGNIRAMEQHYTKIWILSLLPDYNLNHQLRIVNERFIFSRRNKFMDINSLPGVLKTSIFFRFAIGTSISYMIFFIFILENKYKCEYIKKLFNSYRLSRTGLEKTDTMELEEEDLMERESCAVASILNEKTERNYPLLVNNLYKCYDRKVALRGISFIVKKQECFGLLGVNGAGKTSAFQIITANSTLTTGTIKIDGYDIIQNESQYLYRFGYCPQNDCLIKCMTAYQSLLYMAKLRGISDTSRARDEVLYWLHQLNLQKFKDVRVQHYSGGTKRKLNAALAMIGRPSLVLLDEPTTGVDPESRRFLWNCIQDFQSHGKTIVLSSHSMDECEKLCNRLAIMTEGQFRCLGYVPELKQRYGGGFTIKIKIKTENYICDTVTNKLREEFPNCDLRENHAGIVTYFIKTIDKLLWSDVFKKTEDFHRKMAHLVEDYSVHETTLEDIVLKFETINKRKSLNQQEVCL